MENIMQNSKRADATIDTPDAFNRESFTISDLSSEFDVVVKGCQKKRASTGRLQFTVRATEPGGAKQTLTGIDARWTSREGPKFTFSPAQSSQLQTGLVASVQQLTDVKVIECSCVD